MMVKKAFHWALKSGALQKRLRGLPLPRRVYQHLYFKGSFDLSVGRGKQLKLHHFGFQVENELFWTGVAGDFEPESLRVWRLLVPHAETIFDVGANTGVYALIARALNPSAHVHAVEPMPAIVRRIQENVSLNEFSIAVHGVGLSNYTGKAVVYTEAGDFQYSVSVNKDVSQGRARNEVPIDVERMDDLAARYGIEQVELMKLDVESHEPEVLEGFGELLSQWQPTLLIEVWDRAVLERILEQTKLIDYAIFHVQDRHRRILPINRDNPSFGGNYLFLAPRHRSLLAILQDSSNN